MKARYAYPLLFLVPSAMFAFIGTALVAGAGAGVLWIFVYGDDPWPPAAGVWLMGVAALAGLLVFAVFMSSAYRAGKARETSGGLQKAHVLVALGLSVGLPLLVLLHQWQVGNLGGPRAPPQPSSKLMPRRDAP